VWPFGLVAVVAGVLVGVLALRGAPPGGPLGGLGASSGWLAGAPAHGLAGHGGRPHGLLLSALLLLIGWGLARRRLVALGAAVLLLVLLALTLRHVGYGIFCVGAATTLVLCHNGFPGVPERGRVLRAGLVGGAALLLGFVALDRVSVVLLVCLTSLVLLLRAAPAPRPAGAAQRALVRAMVARPGADTLAPFVLRSDKSYLFSADGSAALGYRVLLGIAVVGGDPVGDPAAFADVVGRFHALCRRRGWRPAVLGARGDLVPLWAAYGMRRVGIGDEVVLDVHSFGLATRRMCNVRQAVRRTHNAGRSTCSTPSSGPATCLAASSSNRGSGCPRRCWHCSDWSSRCPTTGTGTTRYRTRPG
jgi:lysyl-tRNA synthetase class 2